MLSIVSVFVSLLMLWDSSSSNQIQLLETRTHMVNQSWKVQGFHHRDSCIDIHVNTNESKANLTHFWSSTGFCPPDPHNLSWKWFESESMMQNLAYIGALPAQAIRQVRIHWLLDAVTLSEKLNGKVVYNFSHLDKLMDKLYEAGLRPGFELMGNPGNIFTDLEDKSQVFLWRDLVMQTAIHYIKRYGLKYVSQWNFECWNEPKLSHFDTLNMTIQGFLNYYDACSEGLKLASPVLRFGGPGGECKRYSLHKYCWALLDHVQNGVNYFTQGSVRMDFISIHKKGEEPDNSAWIMKKELDTIKDIHSHFPNLAKLPIYNDEADPLVGWSKPKWWRADSTYAAIVAKVIFMHQENWLSKVNSSINFQLLSNDNGFLSYGPHLFAQRTLLARFQINNTIPPSVQYIVKPVYSVMALLALMGDQQLKTQVMDCQAKLKKFPNIGVLGAVRKADMDSQQRSTEWTIFIYNSYDTHNVTGSSVIRIHLDHIQLSSGIRFVVYQLSNDHGNPYKEWALQGRPLMPSIQQLRAMRRHEGPVRTMGPEDLTSHLTFNLPLPGVILLQACLRPSRAPGQVTKLRLHSITQSQVLLVWDDSDVGTRCLSSYDVTYSLTKMGPYQRINHQDFITNYFVHDLGSYSVTKSFLTDGFYRVQARDFWGRSGLPCVVEHWTRDL